MAKDAYMHERDEFKKENPGLTECTYEFRTFLCRRHIVQLSNGITYSFVKEETAAAFALKYPDSVMYHVSIN